VYSRIKKAGNARIGLFVELDAEMINRGNYKLNDSVENLQVSITYLYNDQNFREMELLFFFLKPFS
jgi:hypothetical protein